MSSQSPHKGRLALGSLMGFNYIKTALAICPAVKMLHLSQLDAKDKNCFVILILQRGGTRGRRKGLNQRSNDF